MNILKTNPWEDQSSPKPTKKPSFSTPLQGPFAPNKNIFFVIGAFVVGVWLLSGFYQINPDEQGIVLRFGKWTQTTEAGWHYHLPYPVEEVLKPRVTSTNQITIGGSDEENLMLTGDRNVVNVSMIVQWHIKNAGDFLFNIKDPEQNIQAVTKSVIREIIGKTPIDKTFAEGRANIQNEAKELVQKILDSYNSGIQISEINLAEVNPPEPVIEAFREVDRAYADQERMFNEAEGYRNDVVPKARGESSNIKEKAAGYKESVIARASGEIQRFLALSDNTITRDRLYFETLEKILKKSKTVILSGKGAQGILPHINLKDGGDAN